MYDKTVIKLSPRMHVQPLTSENTRTFRNTALEIFVLTVSAKENIMKFRPFPA